MWRCWLGGGWGDRSMLVGVTVCSHCLPTASSGHCWRTGRGAQWPAQCLNRTRILKVSTYWNNGLHLEVDVAVFVESKVGVQEGRRPVSVNPSCQLIQLKKKKKEKKMSTQLQRIWDWSITLMTLTPVEDLLWPYMTRKRTKLLLIRNGRLAYTHKQYVWLRINSWAEDYLVLKCNKDEHNTWSWNDD